MSDEIERRSEIVLRRMARFFGSDGLPITFKERPPEALYDRYERRDDCLIEFRDIANWLIAADPRLTRHAAIQLFVLSAKHGGFGWRQYGSRRARAVARLLDLQSFGSFAAGQYVLRPSSFMVAASPEQMRAPRSVWVQWLRMQKLPVPVELASSIVIEANDRPRQYHRPKREIAIKALGMLYPPSAELLPQKTGKSLVNKVNNWIKENPSDEVKAVDGRTVGRALEELRSRRKSESCGIPGLG
jgi:hypothetical protein